MLAPARPVGRLRTGLRRLFYGHRPAAVAFQAGLLALDLAALAYFLATTFVADAPWVRTVDLLLGLLLLLEFLGRLAAHRHPMHYLDNAAALIDIVVILSLFLSALVGNLAFLRILRTVRLLRSYNVLGRLKKLFPAVRRNEEVITAALDLAVFMLIVAVDRLCHPARGEPEDRRLPRRALLHRDDALDDRLRRRHAGGRARAAALDGDHDRRHLAVLQAGSGCVPPGRQGTPPVPALRPAAARTGRGALQGVRAAAQHPERRGLTVSRLSSFLSSCNFDEPGPWTENRICRRRQAVARRSGPQLVHAALEIAGEVGWEQLRLARSRTGPGLPLAEIGRHFRDVDAIADAWSAGHAWPCLALPRGASCGRSADERVALPSSLWLDSLAPWRRLAGEILRHKLYLRTRTTGYR